MENAAKALIIAAGVLIGLMIVSLMVFGYQQISSYYTAKEENVKVQQLASFNKQYTPYDREDVRGSELLSLINKIVDFNATKMNDVNEEKIEIVITIADEQEFYYKYSETASRARLIRRGTPAYWVQYTAAGNLQDNITSMLNTANAIERNYPNGMAAKLAANISTLEGDNSRKTKRDLLVELKIIDADDEYANPDDYVDNDEILKYYQYQQFKRAHFDCTNLTFTEQGRVRRFTFRFNGTFE